ncbi:MAG: ATP-dependent Clp protease adaptor ClpS [Deltaproteobacteria bacterium]|nr:ATP-dependent Clp protease adaptor ClpS [Deltaproteobacteria bacterium]
MPRGETANASSAAAGRRTGHVSWWRRLIAWWCSPGSVAVGLTGKHGRALTQLHDCMRLARSLAILRGDRGIRLEHVLEALSYAPAIMDLFEACGMSAALLRDGSDRAAGVDTSLMRNGISTAVWELVVTAGTTAAERGENADPIHLLSAALARGPVQAILLDLLPDQLAVMERAQWRGNPPRSVFHDSATSYAVVLHNDDFTTMQFVVSTLTGDLALPEDEATALMLQVHHQGHAVCAHLPREPAEALARAMMARARAGGFPLTVTVRPAEPVQAPAGA